MKYSPTKLSGPLTIMMTVAAMSLFCACSKKDNFGTFPDDSDVIHQNADSDPAEDAKPQEASELKADAIADTSRDAPTKPSADGVSKDDISKDEVIVKDLVKTERKGLSSEELAVQQKLSIDFEKAIELAGKTELLTDCTNYGFSFKKCQVNETSSLIKNDVFAIESKYRRMPGTRVILDLEFIDAAALYTLEIDGVEFVLKSIVGKQSFPLLVGENTEISLRLKSLYIGETDMLRSTQAIVKSVRLYVPEETKSIGEVSVP